MAESEKTQTAILGPFFRHDAPTRENGTSTVDSLPSDGEVVLMHGKIMDFTTKKPVVGASIDVWQASTNGLYEQQDDKQPEHNLRGKFYTDSEGRYTFYCLRPTPYPVPDDGPAGKLLKLLDRHPFRPAHIHLIVSLSSESHRIVISDCSHVPGATQGLPTAHHPDLRPQGQVHRQRLCLRRQRHPYWRFQAQKG